MTEQLHLHTKESLPIEPAVEALHTNLQELSVILPEVADNYDAISDASESIITDREIEPDFFDDTARSVVFAGLALRQSRLSELTDPIEAYSEQVFLTDAIAGLIGNFRKATGKIETEDGPLVALYDRFTDKNLSQEVKQQIDGGLLADVKKAMGITDGNEEEYQVRVLSIDNGKNTHGLSASHYEWNDEKTYEQNMKGQSVSNDEHDSIKEYKEGLFKRAQEFATAEGVDVDDLPSAWVHKADGVNQLCITMPLAEKILHPELTVDNPYYSEADREREVALLKHEYVHTQGHMNIDNDTQVGIALEEVRAEHFSGNKMGYLDAKWLATDVRVATGFDVRDLFDSSEKGGNASDVYIELVKQAGMNGMLEVLLLPPVDYCDEARISHSAKRSEHLGGADGVIEKMLTEQLTLGKGAEIEDRIDKLAEVISKLDDPEMVIRDMKRRGRNIVPDMIQEKLAH